MRLKFLFLWPAVLVVASMVSCSKKEAINLNEIYFTDPGNTGSNQAALSLDNSGGALTLSASCAQITAADVPVTFMVDTGLVAAYNTKNGTHYKKLPQHLVSLSSNNAVIRAGSSISEAVKLIIAPPDSTVSDGDQLIIPVRLTSASHDYPVLQSSAVLYVIPKRILTNAALDISKSKQVVFDMPDSLKDVATWTVEMRVRSTGTFVNNMTLFSAYPNEIYSRFGDVVIKPNQLQVKYTGSQPSSSTEFAVNTWYHIAFSFDGNTGAFKIYVNGKLDNQASYSANSKINVYTMAFGNANNITIQVQELRFWTRVVSQTEIINGMCAVDPASDRLFGYWKFNEGTGKTVKDYTNHGHTGRFQGANAWVPGIRCPN